MKVQTRNNRAGNPAKRLIVSQGFLVSSAVQLTNRRGKTETGAAMITSQPVMANEVCHTNKHISLHRVVGNCSSPSQTDISTNWEEIVTKLTK
ncbi:hypothetical protein PoB_000590400 [Plakobranchus ocellatus]|uniref:Uncharacterized protein n=1 Tax=Plakobranchus ocellatus TaxID=259542 RepID=A0AAV3YAS7_9GAST|nr:hypothetical protein PoB_000590400 [Plakobranchus ocellatus]